MIKYIFFTILTIQLSHTKLLDKLAGVINEKVVTLSDLNRTLDNLTSRKEISPTIYGNTQKNQKSVFNQIIQTYIIRKKLSEVGYIISDESVENRIEYIEKMQNVDRSHLISFLKSKNLTYEEYFEIIKATMEFQQFKIKIIQPLISITDQEIKNYFYSQIKSGDAVSFTYTLLNFTISKEKIGSIPSEQLKSDLLKYKKSGILPEYLKDIESRNIDKLNGENLNPKFSNVLRKTKEGDISQPIIMDNIVHLFFVQKKDLVESQNFKTKKNQLRLELMSIKSKEVVNKWINSEKTNYFIKNFI